MSARRALVLGGFGGIGSAIAAALAADGLHVERSSRSKRSGCVPVDPDVAGGLDALAALEPFDAVVWAQGANVNDSIEDFDRERFEAVQRANVTFVAHTMAELLARGKVRDGARLVVLSSIWQALARQTKLSYVVSKAALGGLVHAAAVDLAARGILVNAVLPGVVDTEMTRATLAPAQVAVVEGATGFGRLTAVEDVAGLVVHLCSQANGGVTGQSIAVDLGFGVGRRV